MLVRTDIKTRQRDQARQRTRALRQRKKDAKKSKGQRRCYRVWMDDSDVLALLNDWSPPQNQLTPRELREHFDQEWIKVAEGVIEQAALSAIKARK